MPDDDRMLPVVSVKAEPDPHLPEIGAREPRRRRSSLSGMPPSWFDLVIGVLIGAALTIIVQALTGWSP